MPASIDADTMNRIKASLLDCYTDFISIANVERDIIYFNPAAYRMMGYGPDERPDIRSTEELHTPEADEIARTQIQPSVFRNGFWRGISYIKHKDGSPLTVEMTVFPIYGQDGEEYGTVAIMRDVDELSRLNEQLRKSTEMFQQVMDSARIGIVLINMETHTIEMANEFTQELLQMDVGSIVGRKCYDMLCHRSIDMCPHIHQQDKFLLSERFIERPDGSMIPIIKTGTRITIGDTNYLVDTFVDISIQKELEKKLQEAKLVAEAANRSKSEFLSRMSHEMRTPLNAIIGMTQITDKVTNVDKLKNCIETIKLSSNHLLGLINDILDLSKIEEGKLELSVEPFSVVEMIKKIELLISPKAREKNIHFDIEMDSAIPPYVDGDALRISQVLLNFLSNAVKFTPELGRIELGVRLLARADDAVTLRFSVRDSGIGITDEQQARLFSPFTQADGSITRKYGGTGLGLVISKRLIHLMDSDVVLESRYGEGSTFSFELVLPISAHEQFAVVQQAAAESIADLFQGRRVLVVDDVDINRIIVTEFLSETGAVCDEAADGWEAVQMAMSNAYDMILMDIQMPELDGYEATKEIRALEAPYGQVPIIAMSANVFKEDVAASLGIGMNAHIGKPVDAQELIRVMNRLLCEGTGAPVRGSADRGFRLRAGVTADECDAGQFDMARALENAGGQLGALEAQCAQFLAGEHLIAVRAAMDTGDYSAAVDALCGYVDISGALAMGAVTAFARNVAECLKLRNYDYAAMYLNDLVQWHDKACDILRALSVTP